MFRRLYLSYIQLNYPELRVTERAAPVPKLHNASVRFLSKLLLFSYALFMLKPALPVISDFLAHTFYKEIHLKIVHRLNGKEHVHYELCKLSKEGEKQKATGKWKADTSEVAVIANIVSIPQEVSNIISPVFCIVAPAFPTPCYDPDDLPPKA